MSRHSSRKWFHFPADEDLVDAVHSAASAKKQSVPDYVCEVLLERLTKIAGQETEEATDLVKIFVMDKEEDDRRHAYSALVRIAKALIDKPDAEKEKKLKALCKTQDFSFNEITEDAEEMPTYDSNGSTIVDSAVQFMAERFPTDTLIYATELSEAMCKAGFGEKTIARAREVVGAKHIRPTGVSGKHGWIIPSFKRGT